MTVLIYLDTSTARRSETQITSRFSPMLTPRRRGLRKTIPKASPLSTR